MSNTEEEYDLLLAKLEEYLNKENPPLPVKRNPWLCTNCTNNLVRDCVRGHLVCTNCGFVSISSPMYVHEYATHYCVIQSQPYTRLKYFRFFLERSKKLPDIIEKRLCMMFVNVNESFNNNASGRRNFIKYNYLINKLLIEIDKKDLAKKFPLPNRKRTLRKYDRLWEKICKDLNYTFVPSTRAFYR
jgi:hypothetical protein